jgi:Fe-Mn family superoxide dismutase
VPLPFDPTKLLGLSERLLVSHHDVNYAGAVKNLAAVQAQLAALPPDAPGFVVTGLRSRELAFANSRVLHELYFANLGGDGKPAGAVQRALAASYGSFAAFESKLRATALGLAGGSGWAIVDLGLHDGALGIHAAGDHTQTLALGAPLLVLDMYEHAYHIDYGAAAAKYVDAFFANLRWDEVDRRYGRALAAARALRA